MTECGTAELQATSQGKTVKGGVDETGASGNHLSHRGQSLFETAVASVCRLSNSEGRAIGSELRTMPRRGTGPVLVQ